MMSELINKLSVFNIFVVDDELVNIDIFLGVLLLYYKVKVVFFGVLVLKIV